MNSIRKTINSLREWISAILEARKEILAELEAEKTSPNLALLLHDYMNLRKAERSDWSQYGKQKGTVTDMKAVASVISYLQSHEIFTLENLDEALQDLNGRAKTISAAMRKSESRMKVITGIQSAVTDCRTHKAVHDKYLKIGWKTAQSIYVDRHRNELDTFNKAYHYLKKQGVDLKVDLKALQAEYDSLEKSHTEQSAQLSTVQTDLKPLKDIRYWVGKVLEPEQVEKKPEPKFSVKDRLAYAQEKHKQEEQTERQKQNKQNIEL